MACKSSRRRKTMSVAYSAWAPGRHAQVAQTQVLVDKIKIVVKALPAVGSQERLARRLVVPWLIGRAGFHRGENGNEPGLRASLLDQRGDLVRFAHAAGADELDFDSILGSHAFSVLAQCLAQRLRKLRVIKDADAPLVQVICHRLAVAKVGDRPLNDQPVIAAENSGNLSGKSLGEQIGSHRLHPPGESCFQPTQSPAGGAGTTTREPISKTSLVPAPPG